MEKSKELLKYMNKIVLSVYPYYKEILRNINTEFVFSISKHFEIDDSFNLDWEIGNPGYYESGYDMPPGYPSISFGIHYFDPFEGGNFDKPIKNKEYIYLTWDTTESTKNLFKKISYNDIDLKIIEEFIQEFILYFEDIVPEFIEIANNPEKYGTEYCGYLDYFNIKHEGTILIGLEKILEIIYEIHKNEIIIEKFIINSKYNYKFILPPYSTYFHRDMKKSVEYNIYIFNRLEFKLSISLITCEVKFEYIDVINILRGYKDLGDKKYQLNGSNIEAIIKQFFDLVFDKIKDTITE